MVIGKSYEALNTPRIRMNDLSPGQRGHVVYVDGHAISLDFPNFKIKVPLVLFGQNFIQCTNSMSPNLGYKGMKHADRIFK